MNETSGDLARRRNRLVLTICLLSIAALPLAWANLWLLFGVVAWAVLLLTIALGFAGTSPSPRLRYGLIATFVLMAGLTALTAWLDRPEAPLRLWGGLPPGTAVLVYGIWPLGALPGLLYLLEFDRSVLPEERLRRFEEKFSRRRKS